MHQVTAICIVDPDESSRNLAKNALESARVSNKIIALSSVGQAEAYVLGRGRFSNEEIFPRPTLFLLDIGPANRGALDFLRWLRGVSNPARRIPVVAFTGSGDQTSIDEAYDCGANSFLLKPFEIEAFRELLKAINGYWILLVERPPA